MRPDLIRYVMYNVPIFENKKILTVHFILSPICFIVHQEIYLLRFYIRYRTFGSLTTHRHVYRHAY